MSTIIKTATIVAGSSMTDAILLNDLTIVGISTGSTIANNTLTMLVSIDGTTYTPLYNTNGEYTITAMTGSAISYNLTATPIQFNYIKFRLGTSGSSINQVGSPLNISMITKRTE